MKVKQSWQAMAQVQGFPLGALPREDAGQRAVGALRLQPGAPPWGLARLAVRL